MIYELVKIKVMSKTWDEFLQKIADNYMLSRSECNVFLAKFAQQNWKEQEKNVAIKLKISEVNLKKKLTSIYSKMCGNYPELSSTTKGKFDKLLSLLRNEYANQFTFEIQLGQSKDIDWRAVCSKMLEKQQETQQLRHQATSMGFEAVHVPLGLVERKEQPREPVKEEITKIYKHKDFLQEVIGKEPLGKNKHAAIVGEAGAGKTTLLSKIASFINLQPEYLPIFISLASLGNLTLQDHLFKKWLPKAMGLADPKITDTSAFERELIKRFREGGVWLLLDAVDEMGGDSPVHALAKIDRELKECFWLGEARVVLTCRLNVWDININRPLTGFDTYRTQEFKPEEIDKFILDWFTYAQKLQLGGELQAKLKEIRHARIYELGKNPLRLALLCQIFYRDHKGEFPETKAALYQRYIRYFYEWKPENYPVELIKSDDLKDELHQALGKLALAGIDSKDRFCLPRSLCRKEMGEKFFKIACDVGWLVLVGITDTDEDFFVFWHQNFQEYFAALVIDNWDYFLNHVPHNPDKRIYRIFEQHWKEVILLWLGRDDVEKYEKDKFLNELVNFNDDCGKSYEFQAFFLAAAGISEFKIDDRQADEIVKLIIKLSFGILDSQNNKYSNFINSITIGARAALIETDRKRALKALQEIIPKIKDNIVHFWASSFLEELSPQPVKTVNKTSIKYLSSIPGEVNINTSGEYKRLLIQKLKKIDPSNSQVIKDLIDLMQKTQEFHIFSKATKALEEICLLKPQAESFLLQLMENTNKDYIRLEAAKILAKIAPKTPKTNVLVTKTILDLFMNFDLTSILPCWEKSYQGYEEYVRTDYYSKFESILSETSVADLEAIIIIIELLPTNQYCRWQIPSILGKIAFGKEEAVMELQQLLQAYKDDTTSWLAAKSLLLIDSLNPDAINTLTNLVSGGQDKSIRWLAAEELWQIGHGNTDVLNSLIEKVCDTSLDWGCREYSWNIICKKHNDRNPDTVNAIINLMLDSNYSTDIRYLAMRELEEIGSINLLVKDAFTRLVNTESDEDIRREAVIAWIKMNSDRQEAIDKAVNVLTALLNSPNQNDSSRLRTAKCLEEVDPGNLTSINVIIDLLLTSNDWEERIDDDYPPSIMQTAADYLNKMSEQQKIIVILKRLKQWVTHPDSSQDTNRLSLCWEIIFHYTKNISYPEFYQVWQGKPCSIQSLENHFIDIASQLNSTGSTYTVYIDAEKIALNTDENVVSKLICTKIFNILSLPTKKIPKISDVADLQLEFIKLAEYLQNKSLFLLFDKCKPTKVLLNICHTLVDAKEIHIGWITDEPLEAPLRGFSPNQPNLITAIQSWINEIE
jgi:HEAT repeat protein